MNGYMENIRSSSLLIPFFVINMVFSAPITCGGIYTNDSGILATPLYPYHYPNGVECVWLIKAQGSKYIELTFLDFDIEPFKKCKTDMLEIKDGDDKYAPMIGGQYCNVQRPPRTITSTSNSLRLWFHADSRDTFRGFKAAYKTVSQHGCGATLTQPYGTVTSPRYPLPYPSDARCHWKIVAPPKQFILIQFLDFEVEYICRSDGTCQCMDKVLVWDGPNDSSTLVGEYCFHSPSPFVSQTNQLIVKFSSSPIGRLRGFKFLYTFSSTKGCGGNFMIRNGTFSSPNFAPAAKISYPSFSNCVWTITAPKKYYISLKFKYFDVKSGYLGICGGDYIEIRDGHNRRSPMIGQYCNSNKPDVILSSDNKIFLNFKSDNRRHGLGFEVEFNTHSKACQNALGMQERQISDKQLSASSSLISDEPAIEFNPSLGRLNGRFAWCSQIQTSPILGEYYQIEFRHLHKITKLATQGFTLSDNESNYVTKYRIEYSDFGSFKSYRGIDDDDTNLKNTEFVGNTNGDGIKTNTFWPPIALRMLRIYPTDYVSSRKKVICLRAELYGCRINFGDGKAHHSSQGRLSFNSAQARHESSLWLISPPMLSINTVFYVNFHSFSIDCKKASLRVSYGSQLTNYTSYCGNNRPKIQVHSATRQLWIQYISLAEDETNSYQWFDLSYFSEDLGKGSILRSRQGILRTSRAAMETPRNESIWIISQPQGKRIRLEFIKLLLHQRRNGTCNDYVEVRDGVLDNSPRLGLFCGRNPPKPQISSGSHLKISLHQDKQSTGSIRKRRNIEIFELKYSAMEEAPKVTDETVVKESPTGNHKMSSSNLPSICLEAFLLTVTLCTAWVT